MNKNIKIMINKIKYLVQKYYKFIKFKSLILELLHFRDFK